MSNLGLKLVQMPVPAWNQGIKQTYPMAPQFLTIHNTANNASARAEISYMIGNGQWVSYHWAVDDIEAIQAIPHNRNAWHCGDGEYGNGNRLSIGIEICHSLTPGNPKYPQSEENGAKLAAIILHQLGWGIDRIRKHQDWSGKYCPHRILDNQNWEGFKGKVQAYLLQLQGKAVATAKPAPKINTTQPKPSTAQQGTREYAESGKFTATENIYFRNEPHLNGKTQGMYYRGESVYYDRVRVDYNGFVWISWISASKGIRRWMPIKVRKNGKTTETWGTVV
ncbi:TPA: N-acetylmuramoyl-L-alanine amidase [Streptococcus suis]